MNVLIAIMADSYEMVKEHEKVEALCTAIAAPSTESEAWGGIVVVPCAAAAAAVPP